jgi:hypothetical protein
MTQQGYRHRILILDRSWSINSILKGQQSGLDEFFGSEASVPGKATYSLWDFDDEIRCFASFAALDEVRGYRIKPRGQTAMLDAIGDAVEAEGNVLARTPEGERPEDVTVIISSDGLENASIRHTASQVEEMLRDQQDVYHWRVIYMGCNQDALKEGEKIGTRRGQTVNTVSTDDGQYRSWKMSASYLSRVPVAAAAGSADLDFTPEERSLGESAEGDDTDDE